MALVNKFFIGIFLLILVLLGVLAFNVQKSQTMPTVTIGDTKIAVEVADTDAERTRGLGGRATLPENQGMLFKFDQEGTPAFWMKDTLIPLDMIWADSNGTIVTIAKNVRPESYPEVFKPTAKALYVLEVNGGFSDAHGIAEGAKLVVQ
ncbi:DUF192 domain-containing protein [Candidatus Parcubacteria bacterium]|nr:DUF192 domain-containing protein [Candidatus Parcubacteria bacterium]